MAGRALYVLLWLLPIQALQAITFMAPVDEVHWNIEASPFACRLSQPIPAFGDAVFEQEAGEGLQFFLLPAQTQQLSGRARLVAEAAPWSPGLVPRPIGTIAINQGQIHVQGSQATQMIAALHQGLMPTFSIDRWYGASQSVSVGIMSINFQSAYRDYLACLTGLLPVNYRQIARTAVLFPTSEHQLSDATRARLDLIAQYVLTDDTVQQIFVDGHTDNDGRRLLLRDLSKRRADEVTRYLLSRGVSEDAIITRFHGDRYPVVANDTPENRTRNRRVTIRLERD